MANELLIDQIATGIASVATLASLVVPGLRLPTRIWLVITFAAAAILLVIDPPFAATIWTGSVIALRLVIPRLVRDPEAEAGFEQGTSLWQDAWRRLLKNKASVGGCLVLMVMVVAALDADSIEKHLTRFTQEENHPSRALPKPPGGRSVPKDHTTFFSLDEHSFASLDTDGSGSLDAGELVTRLTALEFARHDSNGDGVYDSIEFLGAPHGLVGFEAKFTTRDANNSGRLEPEEVEKFTEVFPDSEARTFIHRYDANGDYLLQASEFPGLPQPVEHLLGTDRNGRDLFTRLIRGGRISLMVGICATFVSFLIGVTWGAVAGFIGGRVDNLMMRFVDVMYGLPFMFLVILLMVVFGKSLILLFIALGAVQWLTMSRIVRGQVISLKNREFVLAARSIGVSTPKIIFRHLIPNALGPIIVYSTLLVPAVMLEEAFLSFLGLGVQPPHASWGSLASDGRSEILYHPWLILWPGIALAVTLLSLNFLGDGLRDALDPQSRKD